MTWMDMLIEGLNERSQTRRENHRALPPKKCPLCDHPSQGYPIWDWFTECAHSGHWDEVIAWSYRMDLRGWVCAHCDRGLGPDTVRAEHSPEYLENYQGRHIKPPFFRLAAQQ